MPDLKRHIDLLFFAAVALLFYLLPQIDLWISGLAYRDDQGFFLRDQWLVVFIYESVGVVTRALLSGLLIFSIGGWLFRSHAIGRFRIPATYLLLVLLLGPGLVVNTVFKDHWGRARPHQVVEFGGDKTFTPAFVIDDACDRNCSFVSGHASVGFFLVGFYYLGRRRRWMVAAIVVGGIIGGVRIVQGGHFASDVIFSFVSVYYVARLLNWAMLERRRPAPATSGA